MSQRAVEVVLGRLATDVALRRRFRESPGTVLRELIASGLELTPLECDALVGLEPAALQTFASAVDRRLRRAMLR